MPSKDHLHDLRLLVQSRYGLILLETDDPHSVEPLLLHLADALELPLFVWSRLRGLARSDLESAVYDTREPAKALEHVTSARIPALYHFSGLAESLGDDPALSELLLAAARHMEGVDGALILTGDQITLPPALQRKAATVRPPEPGAEEYRELLSRLLRDLAQRQRVRLDLDPQEIRSLLGHLNGLSLMEAEKILTKAIIEDGMLSAEDIRHVIAAKRAILEREGLLEYYPTEENVAGVADLRNLKDWLAKRKAVVTDPAGAARHGLRFPRGLLLLGVPGCGKSLSAKAVAHEWGLPLLKLDPSSLYNKYIGESEQNFKRAIRTAERMAPLVLWIDELEKAFAAAGSEDGGVSQRILGTFLSWLQERSGDVFVVATANDVQRLPAELLRKGRFDEIFFVDLPDLETRREVFAIHLKSRGKNPDDFDLDPLAHATEGFSGSEIEEVVVASLYTSFAARRPLDQGTLLEEAHGTRPLSITMAERVAALREWARGRTVPAN